MFKYGNVNLFFFGNNKILVANLHLRAIDSSKSLNPLGFINHMIYRFQVIKAGTEEFFTNLQEMWPNIPILHWWNNKDRKVSDNCWKIPNILDLHYSNKYWQVKKTSEGTIYLYAAYYDIRKVLVVSIEIDSITVSNDHILDGRMYTLKSLN